jgi:hypothetical protein
MSLPVPRGRAWGRRICRPGWTRGVGSRRKRRDDDAAVGRSMASPANSTRAR